MDTDDIVMIVVLILSILLLVVSIGGLIYGLCTGTLETKDSSSSNFNSTTWAINPANPASPTFHMIH